MRQHYLPEFYLRKFSDTDGLLWVYDREDQAYRRVPPRTVAVETDLYTLIDKKGEKNYAIETDILHIVDSPIRAILEKLNEERTITGEERELLSVFVSFQMTRVPGFQNLVKTQMEKAGEAFSKFVYSERERVAGLMRNYEEETGEKLDCTPEMLIEAVQGGHIKVRANESFAISYMIEFGFNFAPLIASLNWRLLVAPQKGRFLLSDRPFVIVAPVNPDPVQGGVGLITPGALKYLPLTPRICLELGEQGAGFTSSRIDRRFVRIVNMNTALNSDRFVIAGSREHLANVVERAGVERTSQEERAQVRVFSGDQNSQLIQIFAQPLAAYRDDGM